MRLLNTSTKELKEFYGRRVPDYAILSHTWGAEEARHEHFKEGRASTRGGYLKVVNACKTAKSDGFDWIWIDTCCIDQTSSAELSEAVNSMFAWYRQSQICYAFLEDMTLSDDNEVLTFDAISSCRWITRGWTLQELIAPFRLAFYDSQWRMSGKRRGLAVPLERATGIDRRILKGTESLSYFSVYQRMTWAARRETTRPEDAAYSLLGLFQVNMPLIYGEGAKRAFLRLQEEIIKRSTDHSLFAIVPDVEDWLPGHALPSKVLADYPSQFNRFTQVIQSRLMATHSYRMTNTGLEIRLPLLEASSVSGDHSQSVTHFAILNCQYETDFDGPLAIPLVLWSSGNFFRLPQAPITIRDEEILKDIPGPVEITILHTGDTVPHEFNRTSYDQYIQLTIQHFTLVPMKVHSRWRVEDAYNCTWHTGSNVVQFKPSSARWSDIEYPYNGHITAKFIYEIENEEVEFFMTIAFSIICEGTLEVCVRLGKLDNAEYFPRWGQSQLPGGILPPENWYTEWQCSMQPLSRFLVLKNISYTPKMNRSVYTVQLSHLISPLPLEAEPKVQQSDGRVRTDLGTKNAVDVGAPEYISDATNGKTPDKLKDPNNGPPVVSEDYIRRAHRLWVNALPGNTHDQEDEEEDEEKKVALKKS